MCHICHCLASAAGAFFLVAFRPVQQHHGTVAADASNTSNNNSSSNNNNNNNNNQTTPTVDDAVEELQGAMVQVSVSTWVGGCVGGGLQRPASSLSLLASAAEIARCGVCACGA